MYQIQEADTKEVLLETQERDIAMLAFQVVFEHRPDRVDELRLVCYTTDDEDMNVYQGAEAISGWMDENEV